jgi:light-harvesting complex I chlorophyll a/b binding protein 4
MLGVAGMLLPEVFTKIGIINVPEWYDAGKELEPKCCFLIEGF